MDIHPARGGPAADGPCDIARFANVHVKVSAVGREPPGMLQGRIAADPYAASTVEGERAIDGRHLGIGLHGEAHLAPVHDQQPAVRDLHDSADRTWYGLVHQLAELVTQRHAVGGKNTNPRDPAGHRFGLARGHFGLRLRIHPDIVTDFPAHGRHCGERQQPQEPRCRGTSHVASLSGALRARSRQNNPPDLYAHSLLRPPAAVVPGSARGGRDGAPGTRGRGDGGGGQKRKTKTDLIQAMQSFVRSIR